MAVSDSLYAAYDARMQRASLLSKKYPFAEEALGFYRNITSFQKRLCESAWREAISSPGAGHSQLDLRADLDLAGVVPHFPDFLSFLTTIGPAPVVQAARQTLLQGPAGWISFLGDFWAFGCKARSTGAAGSVPTAESEHVEPLTEFILRGFLQPFAELRAAQRREPPFAATQMICPLCESLPMLGVLRAEGDGGKRNLMCSFCLHEWEFRRIFCPSCREEGEGKLPVYVAEQFSHIRVECCETCRFFMRSVDLTKDGHAVPVVDDLSAIPLTLWAQENSYSRLQQNLLGT